MANIPHDAQFEIYSCNRLAQLLQVAGVPFRAVYPYAPVPYIDYGGLATGPQQTTGNAILAAFDTEAEPVTAPVTTAYGVLIPSRNATGGVVVAGDCVSIFSISGHNLLLKGSGDDKPWAVVVVGGRHNDICFVVRTGVINVTVNANANVGDYLQMDSGSLQADVSPVFTYRCFAQVTVANTAGAGGQCLALLMCATRFQAMNNANFGLRIANCAGSVFTSTISGAPTATTVVYGAVLTGNENCIVPADGYFNFMRIRLYNTTRGTYRLIESVNVATNTITTTSSTDTWANGDALTIESPTVLSGSANKYMELEWGVSVYRALYWEITNVDSGAGGQAVFLHPLEAFASSKQTGCRTQAPGVSMLGHAVIKLIGGAFAISWAATGAATRTVGLTLTGIDIAEP